MTPPKRDHEDDAHDKDYVVLCALLSSICAVMLSLLSSWFWIVATALLSSSSAWHWSGKPFEKQFRCVVGSFASQKQF
jgi:hypothetical protein